MSKKAPRITALRFAILAILRDALNPMTVAHIYAAEPEGHNFHSPDNIKQAINPLEENGRRGRRGRVTSIFFRCQ